MTYYLQNLNDLLAGQRVSLGKKQQESYRGLRGKIHVAHVEWQVTIGVRVGISQKMFKADYFFLIKFELKLYAL